MPGKASMNNHTLAVEFPWLASEPGPQGSFAITVWHSLFVCFVSLCIHLFIPTSARFLFGNLFMETFPIHVKCKMSANLAQDGSSGAFGT